MSLEWIRLAIIETLMYSLDEIHQSHLLNIRYIHILSCCTAAVSGFATPKLGTKLKVV